MIAWTVNDNDYTMTWTAKDYAPVLELSITSDNTGNLVVNGSSIGPWYSKDCVYHHFGQYRELGGEWFLNRTVVFKGLCVS